MKKGLAVAAVIMAAMILAGTVWGILSLSKIGGVTKKTVPLDTYLQENWPNYGLESYDQGVLILNYSISITYEQAEKYGQSSYGELVNGHVESLKLMLAGIRANCAEQPELLILNGRTTDGKTAYTVTSSGTVNTCWKNE